MSDMPYAPSPCGDPQPAIWLSRTTKPGKVESGHPTYKQDDRDLPPIYPADRWTPPFTHYPKDVADAPLDPFFRADYLKPQAAARNMSPDAFILFLARKYHLQVYPWRSQPLSDDPTILWTFLVEEAKRPELKRRTFSLFLFLLVDMEVERWWHTGAKPVPEPAAVASALADKAVEDFNAALEPTSFPDEDQNPMGYRLQSRPA
jgi:hypothetical protein